MIALKDDKNQDVYLFPDHYLAQRFAEHYFAPNELFEVPIYYSDGSGWNGKRSGICYGQETDFKLVWFWDKQFTNNECEYKALLECCRNCDDDAHILIDSLLVLNQLKGIYRIKEKKFENYVVDILELKHKKKLTFEWVKRDKNLAGKYIEGAQKNE